MELTKLLNNIKVIQVIGEVQRKDISGIFYDSRKVLKNSVFAAIKGYKSNGHSFIMSAINNGATAIIMDEDSAVPDDMFTHSGITKILVEDSRKALAEISSAFYKDASNKFKIIGITGTNGKTTTSYIIKSILEKAGYKVGLLGTIANYIGNNRIDSKLTTPEANELNEMLLNMYNEGCKYCVMEVSSHSLILSRVHGIHFSTCVFTNITSDHLDFHGSFENYFSAKKLLFDRLSDSSYAVLNSDDVHSDKIEKDTRAKTYYYGKGRNSDCVISNIVYDLNGTKFDIEWKNRNYKISTSLIGEFNAYNAAAAFTAAVVNEINTDVIIDGIKKTSYVPGRFEVVGNESKKAVIDYSHTADSLEKAILALRNLSGDKKIITVFGCGGDRDKTKRPIMGKIATELSDQVIITSDNPRFENPFDIINEIKTGISKDNFKVIENREEAIADALKNSDDDSVILIAGKGHEDYQEIKGSRAHFSDKETAEKYLN